MVSEGHSCLSVVHAVHHRLKGTFDATEAFLVLICRVLSWDLLPKRLRTGRGSEVQNKWASDFAPL